MKTDKLQFYRTVKHALNAVGPGMCLAKWRQTTLHLENGHNHSCHHPRTHQTPLEELAVNPSALHNTKYKKYLRQQMLNGERPDECRYCWNIEDTVDSIDTISDRVIKSAWELTQNSESIANTVTQGADANPAPTQLEVSFSTTCNFKCSYCSADVSSRWMKEILKYGEFPTEFPMISLAVIQANKKMPISDKEYNPYIEAFWKWWPELYPQLRVFRITGGEPLLHKNTFAVLDWIVEHPQPDLEFAINSNMCVPPVVLKRFIDKIKQITEQKLIKSFTLYTSAEAYQSHAEYIRFGLDYVEWRENCRNFLQQVPNSQLSLMCTYNAMSVLSYLDFLKDMSELKKEFRGRLHIDTVYMANPKCLTVDILTEDFMTHITRQRQYAEIRYREGLFGELELLKIQRIEQYFTSRLESPIADLNMFRRDFATFVDEHDRRRGTQFLKTFPKMIDFYNLCKQS